MSGRKPQHHQPDYYNEIDLQQQKRKTSPFIRLQPGYLGMPFQFQDENEGEDSPNQQNLDTQEIRESMLMEDTIKGTTNKVIVLSKVDNTGEKNSQEEMVIYQRSPKGQREMSIMNPDD
jgi:hypothetical protein